MPAPNVAVTPATGIRMAIAQVRMHWTIEENLQEIRHALRLAHAEGAALCAFSELAVTGCHRELGQIVKPELVGPAVEEARALGATLGIAIVLGAPTFDAAGARYITHHLIDERGEITASVTKQGLTDPEATLFARGATRPIGRLRNLRCTAVICREVADFGPVTQEVPKGAADVIFVPGALRQDPDKPWSDPPPYVDDIRALAVATGAYMVQTNWPNSLNRPGVSVGAGNSCVVSPEGELLFRLPSEAPGVGVFRLGEATFDWHPSSRYPHAAAT